MASMEDILRQGASCLGLALSDTQVSQLLQYQDWLAKWNRVYNLTAVREPQAMLVQHLLDSLSIVGPLRAQLAQMGLSQARLLDVGSGGGLPGVVIAIALPEVQVHCVDTVQKKALFIQQVSAAMGLKHLKGIHSRVEQLRDSYDVVSSRAFASLKDFTTWSRQALAPHGVWMAMKGKHPAQELTELGPDVTLLSQQNLHVPGLDAERCVLWLKPSVTECA